MMTHIEPVCELRKSLIIFFMTTFKKILIFFENLLREQVVESEIEDGSDIELDDLLVRI